MCSVSATRHPQKLTSSKHIVFTSIPGYLSRTDLILSRSLWTVNAVSSSCLSSCVISGSVSTSVDAHPPMVDFQVPQKDSRRRKKKRWSFLYYSYVPYSAYCFFPRFIDLNFFTKTLRPRSTQTLQRETFEQTGTMSLTTTQNDKRFEALHNAGLRSDDRKKRFSKHVDALNGHFALASRGRGKT